MSGFKGIKMGLTWDFMRILRVIFNGILWDNPLNGAYPLVDVTSLLKSAFFSVVDVPKNSDSPCYVS